MLGRDSLFSCEGEMAQRLAAHDWSTTPLGPLDSWSPSLRTAVAIVLRSRYPMLLSWGEHLVMIYNDAFIPTLGTKHPGATGGLLPEQFAEVWGDIGAMQRSVLAGGAATWDEDLRLPIERGAGPEEFFFTFSYSHVPDESGPGGVLAVLTVTTDKVVAARRLSLLNDLAVVASDQATDPAEAMEAALQVLAGDQQDLVGGALYRAAGPGSTTTSGLLRTGVFGEVHTDHLPPVIEHLQHPANQARSSQAPVITSDCVALPVRGPDEQDVVLVLLPHPLRPVDVDHERFLSLVGDQFGQILTVATARAREHARLEALAVLDAAKTAFLSNVSHEFRTPLTLLLGPLEDVLEGRQDAIDRTEAAVMHHSAHRLLRLVNALLDVARIEADGLTAELEPTDLAQVTRDLLQPFVDAAARAGLEMVLEVDPHLGPVMADPSLWEKIVLNLVANAVKYTLEGTVTVVLSAREEQVVLRVVDTGIGIPADQVGKVFDRFHRVHDSRGRSIEGTGIGLTLVAEAAKAMGGTAVVDSDLGAGSSFEVVLPLLRAEGTTEPLPSPSVMTAAAFASEVSPHDTDMSSDATSLRDTSSGPVILVVEDNPALRARVAGLLTSIGRVVPVTDGLAALERLNAEHVDLVVTDVMMPRLDGLGLLAAIRSDAELRSTPVILLSARAGSEAAAGAIEAGADDYVIKPFTSSELLARCRMSIELADYRARSAESHGRGAMLAGVSHDMQTPLAVINTALGLLAEPDVAESQRGHIAARAQVRAAQLGRLVAQFLDWSRLSMNQPLPVRMELVDLVEVVVGVASEHVRIRVTGNAEPGRIWCDRQRTEQILHNLVDNAQRAARTGIEIQLETDEDALVVRVADDGTGVAPEVLPSLFDAFGATTASRGNGLGLHVSREAARAQGGTLALESTGAEGSVFVLRLPRQRSQ